MNAPLNRRGLALVALACCLALAGATTAATDIYEVDNDHDLTSEEAIREYAQEGHVTGEVDGLNMTLTVADDADMVGLSDLTTRSTGQVFLRVTYHEELNRTVRMYVPSAYFEPRVKRGLEAANADLTADLEPGGENRSFTVVTVTLDGPTTAVFPISVSRGQIAEGRSWVSDVVGNATGFELPSLTTAGEQWTYLPNGTLTGDDPYYRIPSNETVLIQYDAAPAPSEEQWIRVRACENSDQPVCIYEQPGSNATFVRAQTDDPPPVRWREGEPSVTGQLESTINDIQHGVGELLDSIGGLFGGNSDDGGEG